MASGDPSLWTGELTSLGAGNPYGGLPQCRNRMLPAQCGVMKEYIDCRKEKQKGEGVETFRFESCKTGGNTAIKSQVKHVSPRRGEGLPPKIRNKGRPEYVAGTAQNRNREK